ncbi:MAG: hypothetical protein IJW70_11535 [Clostridia bacterium]|nr:hypothetical protein [Clostridia bacterium]
MNKSAKIAIIVIYSAVVLLTLALVVGLVVSIAKNGVWGTVENVLGDYDLFAGTDAEIEQAPEITAEETTLAHTDVPETEPATESVTERETQRNMQELFGFERTEALEEIFDFDRIHEPTREEVRSIVIGMTYQEVIAITGKPHGYYETNVFENGDYTVFWCTEEGYEPYARWISFTLSDEYESEQERWENARVSDISAG